MTDKSRPKAKQRSHRRIFQHETVDQRAPFSPTSTNQTTKQHNQRQTDNHNSQHNSLSPHCGVAAGQILVTLGFLAGICADGAFSCRCAAILKVPGRRCFCGHLWPAQHCLPSVYTASTSMHS
jgi:hypothetical protein